MKLIDFIGGMSFSGVSGLAFGTWMNNTDAGIFVFFALMVVLTAAEGIAGRLKKDN